MLRGVGIALVVFLGLVHCQLASANQPVKLANGEWPPFYGADLPGFGIDSKVVTESFALKGVSVEYGFFPWSRSYGLSKKGDWHGTLGWPRSEDRLPYHHYSKEPINAGEWVFFHRKENNFDWQSVDDLKGMIVGYSDDDWAHHSTDPVTTAIREQRLNLHVYFSDQSAFKKLLTGKIDILPLQKHVGYARIKNALTPEQASELTHHPKPFNTVPLYLLLSKQRPENAALMELFNQGFNELKSSGKYQKIIGQLEDKR